MKTIMIPITNEPYEIPDFREYTLPNKVVEFIQQLEEENKKIWKRLKELEAILNVIEISRGEDNE